MTGTAQEEGQAPAEGSQALGWTLRGGTDAQGEVMVKVEEGPKTVTGHGADTDIIVASAKAYLNALNKLACWKSRKDDGPKIHYI